MTATDPTPAECRWCPPGCKSCEPDDCECYTHQDEPDKAAQHTHRTGDAYWKKPGCPACYPPAERDEPDLSEATGYRDTETGRLVDDPPAVPDLDPTPAERDSHRDEWWCGFCGRTHRALACPPAVPDTGDDERLTNVEREALRPVLERYARWESAHDGPVFEAVELILADRLAAHDARVRRDTAEQIAQTIEAHGSLYDRNADWRDGVDEAADIARQAGTR